MPRRKSSEPYHNRVLRYCYQMGKDAALNGANKTNCNFALFATKEMRDAWERGKASVPAAAGANPAEDNLKGAPDGKQSR